MKMKLILIIGIIALAFISCNTLNDIVDEQLTEDEIVQGLKTALEVGTDTSTTVLSAVDGYYKDKLLKILLPPEGEKMLQYVSIIETFAGSGYVEQTIKSINRSAEEAAKDAKPIFIDAITSMTIQDGLNILQGKSEANTEFDSIAATNYLIGKTRAGLVGVYAPKIDAALDKDLLGKGLSANELWSALVVGFNTAITLNMINEEKIDPSLSLGEFTTGKALDGLFYKVGEEEKKIRKNPFEWALDILRKVFGSVHQEG